MSKARVLTPAREKKFREVIGRRQPDLTVVLENIDDPHNISAILRSCDAVGTAEVYVLNTSGPKQKKLGKRSSASARKWVKVNYFDSLEACVTALREKGMRIWATHLSAEAKGLYELDMLQPTALVFGNEHSGVSEEMLKEADGNFIIPMAGMIPSLNVSVACAVSLYEAYRQREQAGRYMESSYGSVEAEAMFNAWAAR